jgi:hypothetical protein
MDVAVSRRMGLFVVARLAARHGIRVRLCPVPSGGLIAQVWLPAEVITKETGTPGRDTGSPSTVRSAPAASGIPGAAENQAVTSIADKLRIGVRDAGHAMPQRTPGRDNGGRDNIGPGGTGPNVIVPDPRLLPARDDTAAPGLHPLANGPARSAETAPATGPLPRLSRRIRPTDPGTGYGPREAEPGPGRGTQRNGVFPAAEASAPSAAETRPRFGTDSGPAVPAAVAPSGEIVVPAAGNGAHHQRLPIFDAVESDWFRRGGQTIGGYDQQAQKGSGQGWSSSSDEGWRAAEVVHAPTSDGTTQTGLPKRVPQANLVPGKVAGPAAGESAGETSAGSLPSRSAAETRDRLASFQHGIRRGRAAATGGDSTAERAQPHETS